MQQPENKGWRRWSTALMLVAMAHVGAWHGYTHVKNGIVPPRPLPAVYVSLLAAPKPPRVAPQSQQPPKPETKPRIKPKATPLARPEPAPTKVATPQREPETVVPVAAPTPPAPVAAAPTPPAPEPVYDAPRHNAAYLNNPPPPYPVTARRRGIEGTVLVRAEVNTDGACNRIELRKGSGSEALDQAALEAVKKWHFVPAKKGTQTVVAWVDIPITFKLEN